MKIRVTLMTENDRDVPENMTDEEFERLAVVGWDALLATLKGSDEVAYVEKCELVERQEGDSDDFYSFLCWVCYMFRYFTRYVSNVLFNGMDDQ